MLWFAILVKQVPSTHWASPEREMMNLELEHPNNDGFGMYFFKPRWCTQLHAQNDSWKHVGNTSDLGQGEGTLHVLQNITLYFREALYMYFKIGPSILGSLHSFILFGVRGQSNWLGGKKLKNWTWDAPHRLNRTEITHHLTNKLFIFSWVL